MTKNIRRDKGIFWVDESHTGFGTRETRGFTVDNLDTKELNEAKNPYEKLFILVRKTLEDNESFCMDDKVERLQLCQEVADRLQRSNLIASPPVRYN